MTDDEVLAKGIDALSALRWCHEREATVWFRINDVCVVAEKRGANGATLAEAVYAWVKEARR